MLVATSAHAYFTGGKYDSPEERASVQAAERALDHRNFDEAMELSRKSCEDFPDSLTAVRVFIAAAYSTGRLSEALEKFTPAQDAGMPGIKAHYARAWAATLAGDPAGGRPEIVRAIALSKKEQFELQRVFLVLRRMDLKENASTLIGEYQQFVAKYNNIGLAHLSYVSLFNFVSVGSAAQKRAIKEALAAPECAPLIYLAAADQQETEFWYDPRTGLELIDKALQEFPESTELAIRKIFFLRRMGRSQEALALAQKWHAIAPNHGDFLSHMSDILREQGRWDEAIAATRELGAVTFQPQYREAQATQLAEIMHDSGDDDAAVKVLSDYVRDNRTAANWQFANQLLTRLQSRQPTEHVKIMTDLPFLQQRGNYCGPASLNMLLAHWGIHQTQDEIAARVYTGIAGTPPQVLHHFARSLGMKSAEFKADEATWKRLIDAGYPILWLQMLGGNSRLSGGGGHYRVVTGYDDILKSWIVHDPNYFTAIRIPYDKIRDTWILPSVQRSLIFFPADRANDPLIAPLKPTPILFITNWAMYVATGANLFVGLFPALLVNILAATLLALAIARLLRSVSFPARDIRTTFIVGVTLLLVVPLNLFVGIFRWSGGVSALLSFHLALLSLIPLLLCLYVLRRLTHDYFHPRETIGLWVIVTAMWLSRSFLDVAPWSWLAPVLIMVLCLPIILFPRLLIRRASRFLLLGDVSGALKSVRKYGTFGENYFSAIGVEIDAHLLRGEYDELVDVTRRALQRDAWPHEHERALRIHLLLAESLLANPAKARADILDFLKDDKLTPAIRNLGEGFQLYNDSRSTAAEIPAAKPISNAAVDDLLSRLDQQTRRAFAGLPISRGTRGRPIQRAAFILALTGAIRIASTRGDDARRAELWSRWGNHLGMIFFLLKGLDSAITQEPVLTP